MTFKDIFPALSRTKVIFQDFPGPGVFNKNIFQEAWEPCTNVSLLLIADFIYHYWFAFQSAGRLFNVHGEPKKQFCLLLQ